MTILRKPQNPLSLSGTELEFPGASISWAGECPWSRGLCYGTHDGSLRFSEIPGRAPGDLVAAYRDLKPIPVSDAKEAINGVAFSSEVLGVSTRNEITFILARQGFEEKTFRAVYEGGAHQIISIGSDRLVAPIGLAGLLVFGPHANASFSVRQVSPAGIEANFYKTARVRGNRGRRRYGGVCGAADGNHGRHAQS